MEKLVLVGSEPLRLALPTPQEVEVVVQFTRRSEELTSLQRLVAKWSARAINDLFVLDKACVEIFDALNNSLERNLTNNVTGFKPWTLLSSQPRYLARALGRLPELDRFIESCFGASGAIKLGNDLSVLDAETTFHDFFYSLFLEEAKFVREIELAPTFKKIEDQEKFNGFSETRSIKNDGWTHTFIWKTAHSEACQFLAKILDGQVDSAIKRVMSTPQNSTTFANLTDNYFNSPFLLIKNINRSSYLQNLRYRRSVDGVKEAIDKFNGGWNKSDYAYILEADFSDLANINLIEDFLFKGIVKRNLNSATTDRDSVTFTDREAEVTGGTPSSSGSLTAKLAAIDAFAAENPGAPVSGKILETFPELESLQHAVRVSAPSEPPAHWPEDRIAIKGVLETPPDFIRRNYAEWLGDGLTRADIRRLDKPLSTALDNWLRRNPMPDDLDLPTIKEQNARWVERIEKEGFGAVVSDTASGRSAKEVLREAQRLRAAQYRHRQPDK